MFEQALVILIVVIAALYSGWQITPLSLRMQVAGKLRRRCEEVPASRWAPIAARAAAAPAGACSACSARGQCPLGKARAPVTALATARSGV